MKYLSIAASRVPQRACFAKFRLPTLPVKQSAVLIRIRETKTAGLLFDLFEEHARVRRGKLYGSKEHQLYRAVLDMEEIMLRWEEGKPAFEIKDLFAEMCQVKFPGWEYLSLLYDPGPS